LQVDDYATDTTLVAQDLAMPVLKYEIPSFAKVTASYFHLLAESISCLRPLVSRASLYLYLNGDVDDSLTRLPHRLHDLEVDST
jgi:hypothetical protein